MSRITCQAGQLHILHFEGCRLTSYRCSAGVWTIGVGHTGPEVVAGLVWTEDQAKAAFQDDLRKAEKTVADLVRVPTSDLQHAVLVSFTFNLGRTALANSTLLRLLNNGNYAGAGEQLARWVHAGARVIPGLVRRRSAEHRMWSAR
jgi:lysozyme